MQHQRGFNVAAMDAETLFFLTKQSLGLTEAQPVGGNDKELMLDP